MSDDWKIAFKAAFKAKEQEELQAAAAAKQAELDKVKAEKEASAEKLLAQQAGGKASGLESKRKHDTEKVAALREEERQANQRKLAAEAKAVKLGETITAQKKLEVEAREAKEEIARAEKRGDYAVTLRVFKKRIQGLPRAKEFDTNLDKLQKLYIDDKFDELAVELVKAEDKVLELVATRDAATTYSKFRERMKVLDREPHSASPERKALALQLTAVAKLIEEGAEDPAKMTLAMKTLEREIGTTLSQREVDADAYDALYKDVVDRLAALGTNEYRKTVQHEGAEAQRKLALKEARTGSLAEANEYLAKADAELGAAEDWAEENRSQATAYPERLDEVKAAADTFEAQNKGFKLACNKKVRVDCIAAAIMCAEGEPGERDFAAALNWLEEAEAVLDGLRERVAQAKSVSDQQALDLAEAKAKQEASDKAKAKAALAKKAAETALAITSLAAIGKNRIDPWIAQLRRLVEASPTPLVTIEGGTGTFWLPGNTTVESICIVRSVASGAEVDRYVMHYHPHLRAKDMTGPNSSRMHAKPKRGNASTPHHLMEDSHWLVTGGYVKRFSEVRDES